MADDMLRKLLDQRWRVAMERRGSRPPREPPRAAIRRTNRAVALYDAGRWDEAERAFLDVLRREGPASQVAPPALFSLGYCRLELDDERGSLQATTLFLELSDEEHPFHWDGVQNVACALDRLGQHEPAAQLYRTVLGARPNPFAYNGLALALGDLQKPGEGLFVLDEARRAGHWDEVLDGSLGFLAARSGGARKSTFLRAPRWPRERVLAAAFRALRWRRTPLPRSLLP